MNPLVIGPLILACLFAGALGGMAVRAVLPEHHVTKEMEDVIKLGTGVIATMSALVIGLLLASARGSFDTVNTELRQFAADLILLDRQMAHYGPETNEARDLLRRYTAERIDAIWPSEASHPVVDDPNAWMLLEDVEGRLQGLVPTTDAQRWLKERALQVSSDLSRTRWLLRVKSGGSIPTQFLVIVVCWLTVIFGSFGLFAPRNLTVTFALFVCALSVAGALFLILEMDDPFGGMIYVYSAPARAALARLGQ